MTPDTLICPGCRAEMAEGALIGAWWDAGGQFRGTYVLCPGCAAKAVDGSPAERDAIVRAAEHELLLAGASPSGEAH